MEGEVNTAKFALTFYDYEGADYDSILDYLSDIH